MSRKILTSLLCAAPLMATAVASAEVRTASFDPGNFSPTNQVTNRWFPLLPGSVYYYKGKRDGRPFSDVLQVTRERATLGGVLATVVHDRGFSSGRLAENTIDWYAQDQSGNVWYLGERTET